ncbi:hypothetical protein [Bordetella petrii]|uniref:hypothetical protein n=1 Tax=Bordetella petrii TaxID=94624 RepID=UPI003731E528
MPRYSDPGIPTLTQRAEPTLAPPTETAPPAHSSAPAAPDLPVLTQVADEQAPPMPAHAAGGTGLPHAAWSTATGVGAGDTVLRAALQAELEQALQRALDDASANLRARLEAELPALIDRAVRSVRPG